MTDTAPELSHLQKAKAALEDARETEEGSRHRAALLDIAQVQAMVAQAEALEGIAFLLDRIDNGFREFLNFPKDVRIVEGR